MELQRRTGSGSVQGTKGETLKGTLGVTSGLYETIQGVYKGYTGAVLGY